MAEIDYLACEVIETADNPSAAVIWLHGLGASGHDFVPIIPALQLPDELGVRFVFPHAPEIPVTINGGMVMPAWFDIFALDIERKVDTAQIKASANATIDLVEREIAAGIPSERIVLAGFSQGGAVCYEAALTYAKPLAGLMTLSTYFATQQSIQTSSVNLGMPIQIMHGTQDPMVPESLGRASQQHLHELGYTADYRTYAMGHEVCLEQVRDISAWFQRVLPAQ